MNANNHFGITHTCFSEDSAQLCNNLFYFWGTLAGSSFIKQQYPAFLVLNKDKIPLNHNFFFDISLFEDKNVKLLDDQTKHKLLPLACGWDPQIKERLFNHLGFKIEFQKKFWQIVKTDQSFNKQLKNVQIIDDSLVIHIRGTDYLTHKHLYLYSGEFSIFNYFKTAILIGRLKFKLKKILVVTDDVNYARSIMSRVGKNILSITEFQNSDRMTDLLTLAKSKYLITSNSTFSLSAAMLANQIFDYQNHVITPKFHCSIFDLTDFQIFKQNQHQNWLWV